MKRKTVFLLMALALPLAGAAQSPGTPVPPPRAFFTAALNFQAIGVPGGVPVQELLRQPGLELGIGRVLNKRASLLAALNLGWLSSRYNGNTLYASGNLTYAPALLGNLRGSVQVGAGAALNSSPSHAWKFTADGWEQSRNTAVNPFVSAGFGLMHRFQLNNCYLAPTFRYQLLVEGDYNRSVPLLPVSMVQAGTLLFF